ncbi:MAG TPA: endonuclease/exonuclease/phosphatase family protein [Ilumatobacteraceae bacterium]|nr:endonuclease/exonuclease/phosphatase family protein [Ilumatobacteraceae bacterium]
MTQFRVMTWNVQNLFEVGVEGGPERQVDFDAKIASLAAVIDRTEPHVLAVQEVGTAPALSALQDALNHNMRFSALGVADERGIRVGFLSTKKLREQINVRAFPPGLLPIQVGDDPDGPDGPRIMNQMGRGALQATVRANGHDVRIVNCHLKSKLLTFPGGRFNARNEDERARYSAYALYRRTSEATTVRAHATAQLGGQGSQQPLLVVGDMNDEVDAATTQILNGPPGSEIGTTGFERPDNGDGQRLWNLAPLIPETERFSRIYRGRPELIDHLFASHFLVDANRVVEVGSFTANEQPLPSIDDNPSTEVGRPGSDHAAVMATFDF